MGVGLQGSGKTTTSAKLADKYKKEGRNPLLAAADIYRPAAIKQLQVLGKQVEVPVFTLGTDVSPLMIAESAVQEAVNKGYKTEKKKRKKRGNTIRKTKKEGENKKKRAKTKKKKQQEKQT